MSKSLESGKDVTFNGSLCSISAVGTPVTFSILGKKERKCK